LRCIARDGRVTALTYADLRGQTSRFANLLGELGVARGDCVFSLLRLGDAKVLVTSPELYRRKIMPIRDTLPGLEHVLIAGEPPDDKTIGLTAALAAADDQFDIPAADPEEMALLHFTSGTTGKPKGAVHVHQAVVAHRATAAFALDLRPGDVFWCTADPGWVTVGGRAHVQHRALPVDRHRRCR